VALSSVGFDRAVSSDLVRAYETARAIVPDLPVQRDVRWREFAFGEWEGLTWSEIAARWPELAERSAVSARTYAPPGGEMFDAVRRRVAAAIADITASQAYHVLVATHAGPLHAMLDIYFGGMDVIFAPASVTRVRLTEGGAELLGLSEVMPERPYGE
jgi:broad specificity phosphatase PhoE